MWLEMNLFGWLICLGQGAEGKKAKLWDIYAFDQKVNSRHFYTKVTE